MAPVGFRGGSAVLPWTKGWMDLHHRRCRRVCPTAGAAEGERSRRSWCWRVSKAARRALISAVLFSLSFKMILVSDSSSIELFRWALVVRIEAVTESRDWRLWFLRRSRSFLASVSSCMLRIMSFADIPRMAAWSSLLSFVQKGAKKETGDWLVGGAREVVAVFVLLVVATVPGDEVVEVMRLEEGEAMLGSTRQGEGGSTQRVW